MKYTVNYRTATFADVNAIAHLHAQSWIESYRGLFADAFLDGAVWENRREVWHDRLTQPQPNQRVLVAVDQETICGFLCAFGNAHPQWGTFIDNLHVASAHKGQGIGTTLMRMAADWSVQTYPDNGMYLEVLEANTAARRFYEALGATHQETNLWLPPGNSQQVYDCLYVWTTIEYFQRYNIT